MRYWCPGTQIHLLGWLLNGMPIPGMKHDPDNQVFFCGGVSTLAGIRFEKRSDICADWKIQGGHRLPILGRYSTWFLKASYKGFSLLGILKGYSDLSRSSVHSGHNSRESLTIVV